MTITSIRGLFAKTSNVILLLSFCWSLGALQAEETTLTNANENPTALTLSSTRVDENRPIGTKVGFLYTIDPDIDDTFTYSLVSGDGAIDNTRFSIDGNQLNTAAIFDWESKFSYSIRLRSTDAGGLWVENIFSITVSDINDVTPILGQARNVDLSYDNKQPLMTLAVGKIDDQPGFDVLRYNTNSKGVYLMPIEARGHSETLIAQNLELGKKALNRRIPFLKDINSDLKKDLVYFFGNEITILTQASGPWNHQTINTGNKISDLDVVDLNNDDLLDILCFSPIGSPIQLIQSPDGNFTQSTFLSDILPFGAKGGHAGDFNKDGKLDIAFSGKDGTGLFWIDDITSASQAETIHSDGVVANIRSIPLKDGDSHDDLVYLRNGSYTTWFSNSGTYSEIESGSLTGIFELYDIEGDGDLDLVIVDRDNYWGYLEQNSAGLQPRIILPDPTISPPDTSSSFGSLTFKMSRSLAYGSHVFPCDLNGDGLVDIATGCLAFDVFDGTYGLTATSSIRKNSSVNDFGAFVFSSPITEEDAALISFSQENSYSNVPYGWQPSLAPIGSVPGGHTLFYYTPLPDPGSITTHADWATVISPFIQGYGSKTASSSLGIGVEVYRVGNRLLAQGGNNGPSLIDLASINSESINLYVNGVRVPFEPEIEIISYREVRLSNLPNTDQGLYNLVIRPSYLKDFVGGPIKWNGNSMYSWRINGTAPQFEHMPVWDDINIIEYAKEPDFRDEKILAGDLDGDGSDDIVYMTKKPSSSQNAQLHFIVNHWLPDQRWGSAAISIANHLDFSLVDWDDDGEIDVAGIQEDSNNTSLWSYDWALGLGVNHSIQTLIGNYPNPRFLNRLSLLKVDGVKGFPFQSQGELRSWRLENGNPVQTDPYYSGSFFPAMIADMDNDGDDDWLAGPWLFTQENGQFSRSPFTAPRKTYQRQLLGTDSDGSALITYEYYGTNPDRGLEAGRLGYALGRVKNGSLSFIAFLGDSAPDFLYDVNGDGVLDAVHDSGDSFHDGANGWFKRSYNRDYYPPFGDLPYDEDLFFAKKLLLADRDGNGVKDLAGMFWHDGELRIGWRVHKAPIQIEGPTHRAHPVDAISVRIDKPINVSSLTAEDCRMTFNGEEITIGSFTVEGMLLPDRIQISGLANNNLMPGNYTFQIDLSGVTGANGLLGQGKETVEWTISRPRTVRISPIGFGWDSSYSEIVGQESNGAVEFTLLPVDMNHTFFPLPNGSN